jgi:hypothetical protein
MVTHKQQMDIKFFKKTAVVMEPESSSLSP